MQVSFTAQSPAHGMLTIQQRLEAAGFTNVHVNAISDTVEPFTRTKPQETSTALAICRTCPVMDECREWADGHSRINGYPLQGIWGGRRHGVKGRPRKDRK